ncbi:Aldehyde dehydrogenase, mitochondrial [Nymphon striatum]|nr:Aldehyde dehydrogenase, mitochondrial [Nymphon striatum]
MRAFSLIEKHLNTSFLALIRNPAELAPSDASTRIDIITRTTAIFSSHIFLETWMQTVAKVFENVLSLGSDYKLAGPRTSYVASVVLFLLPPGVFNVVTGGGAMGSILATHLDVDKVAFTGSTDVGVVNAIYFNQGQVCSAGSKLLVQESVYDKVIEERMTHLRLGSSLDKAVDMGAVVDQSQKKTVEDYVQSAHDEGAQVI